MANVRIQLKDGPPEENVSVLFRNVGLQTFSFGCHSIGVNNVYSSPVSSPLKARGFTYNTDEDFFRALVGGLGWAVPKTMTSLAHLREYLKSLSAGEDFLDIGDAALICLGPLFSSLWAAYGDTFQSTSTVLFNPVVNYGVKSRGKAENNRSYLTDEFIKWLIKNKGGSWYGLPVTRNKAHSSNFGHASFHQPIIWNPDPLQAFSFKDTRFEYHSGTNKKYGYVKSIDEIRKDSTMGGLSANVAAADLYNPLKRFVEEINKDNLTKIKATDIS